MNTANGMKLSPYLERRTEKPCDGTFRATGEIKEVGNAWSFFFLHSSISHIAFMLPQSVACMPEETTVSRHTQKEVGGRAEWVFFVRSSHRPLRRRSVAILGRQRLGLGLPPWLWRGSVNKTKEGVATARWPHTVPARLRFPINLCEEKVQPNS